MGKEYVYNFMSVSKEYLEGQPFPICMDCFTDEDMFLIAHKMYDIFSNLYRYTDYEIMQFYHGELDDDKMNKMDDLYLECFERIALEMGAKYYEDI